MCADILISDICLPGKKGEKPVTDNCCIAITGDTLTYVGPAEGLQDTKAARVISGRKHLALPGLVNTHCHGAMTLFRGLADDLELTEWLNKHIFPAEAENVSPEMVYWCTKLAAAEMIMSGTTTVADGYFFEHEAARAFIDTGMRAVAAQAVIDFPAPGVPDPAKNIAAVEKFIDHWQGRNPLITPAVFAHSPYTCSNTTLQAAKKAATAAGVLLFIHLAETRHEQSMIEKPLASSPVKHLAALGILDADTVCVHCVWTDEHDLDLLAQHRSSIAVCPQSHLKLASGIAPLQSMLAKDIQVGLGTDGAASNNGLDLFREMDICAKIQKVRQQDPVAVPAESIMAMATTGGAATLGMDNHLGSLKKGMKADIILLNCNSAHLQPMHGRDILVYAANGADVQTVIINGKLVMEEREMLLFDIKETLEKVRNLAGQLHKSR
ncbi:MAG: amidohydrolase [Desulfobulbus sp.]|nr:MAG: amidohydrolase [Desulfobulbus sp.]